MKIKELSADDRPREKMLSKGVSALSNAELLAILIRSGSGGKNALELSQEALKASGGTLTGLSGQTHHALGRIKGIGTGKALSILAALELGRRAFAEERKAGATAIRSPPNVFDLMLPRMRGLDHEECWILYLNRANFLTGKEMISSGGLSSTTFDVKHITRHVLDTGASAVMVIHNHPSGNPLPGKSDLLYTEVLRRALSTFDIRLVDHVIVCDDRFFSFSDNRVTRMRE